jgi:hypothetical protein
MFSILKCFYAVPHDLLTSLVPLFFQALGIETRSYSKVCCALTDYEAVAGLNVYSLCNNGVMEYSNVQKCRYRIRHGMKEKIRELKK